MQSPFRFVLVGGGNISRTYSLALDNVPQAAWAGIVSRRGVRPPHFPESVPVFTCLADVPEPFDAVILCTPNGLHAEGAIEAARLGKHVLTEKVLEISVEKMDRMMEACAAAGVKLAVTYQRRMSPDNQALKKLIETNALGRVFAADMRVKFYRDRSYYESGAYRGKYEVDGGGPFMQQASHNVDLMCWFFGMPRQVTSMLGTLVHPIEVEDHGVALLEYPGGMIATITASSAAKPGFPPVLEVHSDLGTVVLENDRITRWAIDGIPNPALRTGFEVHSGAASAAVRDTSGHEAILRDFVEACREERDPAVPAVSGRLATELVLEIYAKNQWKGPGAASPAR